MTKLSALVVEDEEASAERLRRLLTRYDGLVEVLGEASDGPTAIEMVSRLRPTLLFLDITLPGCDGFEVVHQLPASTHVIFTTANESEAGDDFGESAADYLLKPIEPSQLAAAIERVRLAVESQPGDRLVRLLCREQAHVHVIPTGKILFLRAEVGYTHVQTADAYYLTNESLVALEKQLDADFLRVHRTTVINLSHVRSLKCEAGDLVAVLGDAHEVGISRRHSLEFRRQLSFGNKF